MYERTTDNNVSASNVGNNDYASVNSQIDVKSNSFLGKVYGYMAIAIFITFAVAFGLSWMISYGINAEDAITLEIALIAFLVSLVGLLVCSIVIAIMSIRQKHSILVPGLLYSMFMGGVMSMVLFVVQAGLENGAMLLSSAFLITSLTMGIMFLLSKVAKNMHWVGMLGIGLAIGGSLLLLVAWILFLFQAQLGLTAELIWLVLLIDAIFFVAMICFMFYDVWHIQQLANRGINSKNLALYCAFILYSDFIRFFLRILKWLIIIFGKVKK